MNTLKPSILSFFMFTQVQTLTYQIYFYTEEQLSKIEDFVYRNSASIAKLETIVSTLTQLLPIKRNSSTPLTARSSIPLTIFFF